MELSKRKHVYIIYKAEDGVIHCERLPIIYNNKTNTYFKFNNSDNLEKVRTNDIKELYEGLEDIKNVKPEYSWQYKKYYFYNAYKFDKEEVNASISEYNKEQKIKKDIEKVERLENELSIARKRLEELRR